MPSPPEPVAFEFTAAQRRRSSIGLLGIAGMVWAAGLVRFTLVDRLSRASGWVTLAVLAVLLVAAARSLASVRPVTRIDAEGVSWSWGPRHDQMAWSEITAVEIQERGTARRVVLVGADRRSRLPVPLTGGSLVGPGPDAELDHKVELIRRAWEGRRVA
jgi:hypothetical protein